MEFHIPVLLSEVLGYLNPKPHQNFIDCTVGGGGHLIPILNIIFPSGKIMGIDLDPTAQRATLEKLKAQSAKLKTENVILIHDNFKNLEKICEQYNFKNIHGILFDLGLSSAQVDNKTRGFSFGSESLDMRFDPAEGNMTAKDILNTYSEDQLVKIFQEFGEEKLARTIAQKIVEIRKEHRWESGRKLAEVVNEIYRKHYRTKSKVHPATKIFQALRIEVNNELENIKQGLQQALAILRPEGRLLAISYHSLEDRIVKKFFKKESKKCICPPEFPQCVCGHEKKLHIITKKPISPSAKEIQMNPRSRSAKLRVAQKLSRKPI